MRIALIHALLGHAIFLRELPALDALSRFVELESEIVFFVDFSSRDRRRK
jgi:hypothetical protein